MCQHIVATVMEDMMAFLYSRNRLIYFALHTVFHSGKVNKIHLKDRIFIDFHSSFQWGHLQISLLVHDVTIVILVQIIF